MTVFVKVNAMVLFQDLSFAESYRTDALANGLSDDERERLNERARDLDSEELANVDEIYEFLCAGDDIKPRFVEMIEVMSMFQPHYSDSIWIDGDNVRISFVTTLDEKCYTYQDSEEMEYYLNEDPFAKSQIGGPVGNYCKFPSRVYPEDQLGELTVSVDVTRVTDETGEVVWKEPDEETDEESVEESEEEQETKHPYYMSHEDLFGEPRSVSLDLDDDIPKKKTMSKRFIPKPIRSVFKTVRALF
jgi:hypothetical protein